MTNEEEYHDKLIELNAILPRIEEQLKDLIQSTEAVADIQKEFEDWKKFKDNYKTNLKQFLLENTLESASFLKKLKIEMRDDTDNFFNEPKMRDALKTRIIEVQNEHNNTDKEREKLINKVKEGLVTKGIFWILGSGAFIGLLINFIMGLIKGAGG